MAASVDADEAKAQSSYSMTVCQIFESGRQLDMGKRAVALCRGRAVKSTADNSQMRTNEI